MPLLHTICTLHTVLETCINVINGWDLKETMAPLTYMGIISDRQDLAACTVVLLSGLYIHVCTCTFSTLLMYLELRYYIHEYEIKECVPTSILTWYMYVPTCT